VTGELTWLRRHVASSVSWRGFAVLSPLILASSLGHARSQDDRLDQVLEASGITSQVLGIEGQVHQQLATNRDLAKLPPADAARVRAAVAGAFQGQKILDVVRSELAQRLNDSDLDALKKFYDDPFIKRVTDLERAMDRPDALSQVEQYARGLQSAPPPAFRVAIIQRLDKKIGGSDFTLAVAGAGIKGTMDGLNRSLDKQHQVSAATLNQRVESVLAQMRQPLTNVTMVSYLFAYRSLTDKELERYVAAYDSPPVSKLMEGFKTGVVRGLNQAGQRVGQALPTARTAPAAAR
jgi:hypothetical protein